MITQEDAATAPAIALLGYGAIAEMHAIALRALGARLLVVAGPNQVEAAAFAERHGIASITPHVDEALATAGIDGVVLASPSQVHAAQSRAALQAGLHVLSEIPLALSLADAEALVELAQAAGRVLMVCHTLRYWEPHERAHAWLRDSGFVARNVVARGLSLRHENVGWSGRRRSWTDDLLWHHGGHIIDEVLTLLGSRVVDVRAAVGPVWPVSGLPMDYAISLRSDDGAIASISLSYNARLSTSDYVVVTDGESLQIQGADVRSSRGPVVEGVDVTIAQERAVLAQDRDFLDAMGGGASPRAAAAAILPTLRIQQLVSDSRA